MPISKNENFPPKNSFFATKMIYPEQQKASFFNGSSDADASLGKYSTAACIFYVTFFNGLLNSYEALENGYIESAPAFCLKTGNS